MWKTLTIIASVLLVAVLIVGYITTTSFAIEQYNPFRGSPINNAAVAQMTDFAFTGNNSGWGIGYYIDTGSQDPRTILVNWNSSTWTVSKAPTESFNLGDEQRTPTQYVLTSVSAVVPNNVWAVGTVCPNECNAYATQTLIEHFNGKRWNIVTSPDVGMNTTNQLNSVSFSGKNNGWAVGNACSLGCTYGNENASQPLIEHWNGKTWTIVSTGTGAIGTSSNLLQVDALSSDNVWIVGSESSGCPAPCDSEDSQSTAQRSFVEHFNGVQWTWQYLPIAQFDGAPVPSVARSISGSNGNNIWVAGYYQDPISAAQRELIYTFNGSSWKQIATSNVSNLNDPINNVVVISKTLLYITGYREVNQSITTAYMQERNMGTWSTIPLPYSSPGNDATSPQEMAISSDGHAMIIIATATIGGTLLKSILVERYPFTPVPYIVLGIICILLFALMWYAQRKLKNMPH